MTIRLGELGDRYDFHWNDALRVLQARSINYSAAYERKISDESFYHFEVQELRAFINEKKIYVVCMYGI